MSMGTRKDRERQEDLWITHSELAAAPEPPVLRKAQPTVDRRAKFDQFVETECARFYAANNGRPSLAPGIYFRPRF